MALWDTLLRAATPAAPPPAPVTAKIETKAADPPRHASIPQERRDRAAAAAVASVVRGLSVSPNRVAPAAMRGGRLSMDNVNQAYGYNINWIEAPPTHESSWSVLELDTKTLSKVSAPKLLQMMCDLSPEISRAVWDFLRLCNPGWEYSAKTPGSKTEDKRARAVIDAFVLQLNKLYGSVDVVFGKLFMSAFIRGAFVGELVLSLDGKTAVDLACPDPITIRFKQVMDPVRGPTWQPGQWVKNEWVNLDVPTIRIVPIDPFPGTPYGRPIAAPALFSALFMLGFMHDLRRVVAQQGYPRLDIEVDLEVLQTIIPPDVLSDQNKTQAWVDSVIDAIQAAYCELEPEDTYVHTSVVKVNRPVGTLDTNTLGAVDGLFKAIERMVVRALKTMPLMMGSTDGMSEANANRQWEITAAGIKSIQHYGEAVVGPILEMVCQANGIQAVVEFRYAELRTAELMRDAQVEQLQILNARDKYEAGFISLDEAAESVAHHKSDHKPITFVGRVALTSPNGGQSPNPDPGANKAVPGNMPDNIDWGRVRDFLLQVADPDESNGHGTRELVNAAVGMIRQDRILRWRREEFRHD